MSPEILLGDYMGFREPKIVVVSLFFFIFILGGIHALRTKAVRHKQATECWDLFEKNETEYNACQERIKRLYAFF